MDGARWVAAHSLGKRAAQVLQAARTGRVLASFCRAWVLATEEEQVLALAWDGTGNGPLHVLLDARPNLAPAQGTRFIVTGGGRALTLMAPDGGHPLLHVDLSHAVLWESRPDWKALRARRNQIAGNAPVVAGCLALAARPGAIGRDALAQAQGEVEAALAQRDRPVLTGALARLCGLGDGLTPAGDDWLAGWLLALWLAPLEIQRTPWGAGAVGQAVLRIAQARTTLIGRTLLACAAEGEADEDWQQLLGDMAAGSDATRVVAEDARRILNQGATSGTAMLAGFLAGLRHMGE